MCEVLVHRPVWPQTSQVIIFRYLILPRILLDNIDLENIVLSIAVMWLNLCSYQLYFRSSIVIHRFIPLISNSVILKLIFLKYICVLILLNNLWVRVVKLYTNAYLFICLMLVIKIYCSSSKAYLSVTEMLIVNIEYTAIIALSTKNNTNLQPSSTF